MIDDKYALEAETVRRKLLAEAGDCADARQFYNGAKKLDNKPAEHGLVAAFRDGAITYVRPDDKPRTTNRCACWGTGCFRCAG